MAGNRHYRARPPRVYLPIYREAMPEEQESPPIDSASFSAGIAEALRLLWLWWGQYCRTSNPVYRRDFERWIEARLNLLETIAHDAAEGKHTIPPPRPCSECRGDWINLYAPCRMKAEHKPGYCPRIGSRSEDERTNSDP